MTDLRPSIPRTPAQATLRLVSTIMGIVGAVVALAGVLAIWYCESRGPSDELAWTAYSYAGIVLGAAALVLITAWLGLRAADDSSRVGPYRNLCYLVGLVTLVAIVWGWGMGTFLLLNPLVLASTVTYVLICSQLADKVASEHEQGVAGEVFMRDGHQRALHVLAEVIVVKGALVGTVTAVAAVAWFALGDASTAEQLGLAASRVDSQLLGSAIDAVVDLAIGMLGIWGSNRPAKIMPFLLLSGLAVAVDLGRIVAGVVIHMELGIPSTQVILDLSYMGACLWLSWKIHRQQRSIDK